MKIFLDLQSVAEALSISESTVQKLTREDASFPKTRKISAGRVGWLLREIQEWAESRPVADLLPVANSGARKGRKFPKVGEIDAAESTVPEE